MLAIALLLASVVVRGQDRLELGLLGGISYYNGEYNPSQQFRNPGPAFGFVGRYVFNDRLAAKALVSGNNVRAKEVGTGDVYAVWGGAPVIPLKMEEGETDYVRTEAGSFNRYVVGIDALVEFNFLSYDHIFRKDETNFTPYLAVGLGSATFTIDEETDKKRVFVLSLPFGIGVKYKLNKLLRVGLDWTFHKTFTDKIDAVDYRSGVFDPTDPYGNGVHKATHNNDWFNSVTATLTFSMWPRKLKCNDGLRTFYRE